MLKPPPTPSPPQQQQQQDGAVAAGDTTSGSNVPSFSSSGGSGGSSSSAGGLVRVDGIEAVSKQLARHAQYVSHGPGLPTALAVHPSFVAVGTRRGLVLLFDPAHGAVRAVLGSSTTTTAPVPPGTPTSGSGSGASPAVPTAADAAEAVTALDVSRAPGQEHFLVAGHASGRVVLWDALKGSALKALPDAHAAPVVGLRFATALAAHAGGSKGPAVVSVDSKGYVAKLSYSRTLWGAWAADAECLLDGKAGAIPALAVLGPVPPAGGGGGAPAVDAAASASSAFSLNPLRAVVSSTAAAGTSAAAPGVTTTGPTSSSSSSSTSAPQAAGAVTISLIAISSERSSFVVSVEPMVKVLHKWERPHAPQQQQQQQQQQQHATPALAWTWAPLNVGGGGADGQEGEALATAVAPSGGGHVPLLARVWGRRLQLLRVTMPSGEFLEEEDFRSWFLCGASNQNCRQSIYPSHLPPPRSCQTASAADSASAGGAATSPTPPLPTYAPAGTGELPDNTPGVALEWAGPALLVVLDQRHRALVFVAPPQQAAAAGAGEPPALVPREVVDAFQGSPLCPLRFSPAAGLLPLGDEAATAAATDGGSKPPLVTYQNCLRRGPPPPPQQQLAAPEGQAPPQPLAQAAEDRVYLLGRHELRSLGRQTWAQRVAALMAQGDWLEGLALALDCYARESEARRRRLVGERGGGKGAASSVRRALAEVGEGRYDPRVSFSGEREEEEEEAAAATMEMDASSVAQRLFSPAGTLALFLAPPQPSALCRTMAAFLDAYLRLGLENAPSSSSSSSRLSGSNSGASSALLRAHFQLLAGVCIEFCLATGRLDRLYGHVFSGFLQAGQVGLGFVFGGGW
jgi:hypothetical protein